MKSHFNLLLAIAAFSLLASACDCPNYIAPTSIKKLVTEQLQQDRKTEVFQDIKLGYYEENDNDERFALRKLAAAGVINYAVERIPRERRIRDGYDIDYRNYRVVDKYKTVKSNTYFVTVSLTPQGQECVVEELPAIPRKEDIILKFAERPHFPEDDVPEVEEFPEDKKDTPVVEEKKVEPAAKEKPEPKTDYDKAKAREHYDFKHVKCYSANVVDVRDIKVKDGKASASFILEANTVTPFGRVLKNLYDGTHSIGEAEFSFFQDKKWVADDVTSLELFF